MKDRMKNLRLLIVTAGLLLAPGLTSLRASEPQKINVILLVLDQLQADRLHCYGNPRATSPNIDRLAREGVRFARFYSVAPWTAPSYATLMTSLFPSRHGVTLFWRPGMPLLDEKTTLLAEVFKAHGYRTGAFVNNALAGRELTGRGFDDYYQYQRPTAPTNITERQIGLRSPSSRAEETLTRLLPWLDQHASEPFFTFVLFIEPHSPYDPPREHDLFKSDAYPDQTDTGYDIKTGRLKRLAMLGDQKAIERLYQLYDGKIHLIDAYVGQLMDHLQKLGLEKNTLVALTSDHGELMYSHPQDYLTFDHRSLYDPVLHIPFVLYGPPTLPRGRVVEALASNLDTAPTLLDLARLPSLPGAQGRSLVPLLHGKAQSGNPYIYAEEDTAIPLRAVRNDRYKLIYNLWNGQKQLFDFQQDPGELRNLADQNPQEVEELRGRLEEWMKENHPAQEQQRARWTTYSQAVKELIVDDQTIGGRLLLSGSGWHSEESPEGGHWEGGCFWIEPGDGSKTAVWRSDNPLLGTYKLSVHYGRLSHGNLATDAPFTIITETGSQTVRVNFNEGARQWNVLGTFQNPRYVNLSNAANGLIIVDAVKFERLD